MKIGILARALAISIVMTGTANAAPTYEIKDGKLMAIRGIYGSAQNRDWSDAPVLYIDRNDGQQKELLTDVEFLDGSCIDVFGKCTSMNSFSASGVTAVVPLFSLLTDGVTIDGKVYDFASNPQLINGCESDVSCSILAGYAVNSQVVGKKYIINALSADIDEAISGIDVSADTTGLSNTTFGRYTRYSRLVAAVPEPATWAMMLIGFGMIGATARYRRKARTVSLA